ncbi:GNAT family N-acetyltransferase [Pyxidicoccus parkwayensis]|uniref:GNAT family N-acetyltransferase n=1 Tax=Pyxidicoccus parkwayensis TaxID=2813578 RepID=UPI001F513C94|nr:GNAT family N-acetyltransferase [Pyxidicoccus parkwaysis]
MTVEVGQQEPRWVLRPARPEDYALFVRLFAELGVDDPPPPASVWEVESLPLTVIAEGPEGVAGYAATEPLGELGYVGQLVVAPSARRQGLGRWMMERLAERLRARGCQRWALNVKRDNTPALRLYASVGLRPARQAANLKLTRAQVAALPAAPPGLRVVPMSAEEAEALTAAWGLMPGKLARYATKASHRLLRLEVAAPGAHAPDRRANVQGSGAVPPPERGLEKPDAGAAAASSGSAAPGSAVASSGAEAPAGSGASGRGGEGSPGLMDLRASARLLFPFFAATPGHARALMEDAFARVGDAVDSLNVVVTDDAPLDALLRAAGAEVRHETFELRGPLP